MEHGNQLFALINGWVGISYFCLLMVTLIDIKLDNELVELDSVWLYWAIVYGYGCGYDLWFMVYVYGLALVSTWNYS